MLPKSFQKTIDAYKEVGITFVETPSDDTQTIQDDSISLSEYVYRYTHNQRLPNCEHIVEYGEDGQDNTEVAFNYDDLDIYQTEKDVKERFVNRKQSTNTSVDVEPSEPSDKGDTKTDDSTSKE